MLCFLFITTDALYNFVWEYKLEVLYQLINLLFTLYYIGQVENVYWLLMLYLSFSMRIISLTYLVKYTSFIHTFKYLNLN